MACSDNVALESFQEPPQRAQEWDYHMFDFPYDSRCYYKSFDHPCSDEYFSTTRAHFASLHADERKAAERACGRAAAIVAAFVDTSKPRSYFEEGCF
jgi:hypothetical protein